MATKKAKKKSIAQRLPRSVLGLCWTLAALHWKTGAAGSSQIGLTKLMGVADNTVRRVLASARRAGVVSVKHTEKGRAAVALKTSTLKELEKLWQGA